MVGQSNKELLINPYTKIETKHKTGNSLSKPNSFINKQAYSSWASQQSSTKGFEKKKIEGPLRNHEVAHNQYSSGRKQNRVKRKNRNKQMNSSIESVEDFDTNPVYIDTGGSNMQ